MSKIRFRYSKTGRAKYISHLDLSATIQRAFIRAGINLKYSEGFNPHPYMSAALPLSVGVESVCELMDIGISDVSNIHEFPALISGHLPEGLDILEAYVPERKFSDLKWVEIAGRMYYDKGVPACAEERLKERYGMDGIEVSKKTKRGILTINIAEFIHDVEVDTFDTDGQLTIKAKISAQNPTLNPDNVISALSGEFEDLRPDFSVFRRLEVFGLNMEVFR